MERRGQDEQARARRSYRDGGGTDQGRRPPRRSRPCWRASLKSLKKGEEVRLVGFGTFSVRERAAGKGRNPATGKEIKIAASKNSRFKAGAALKASLNKKSARRERGASAGDAADATRPGGSSRQGLAARAAPLGAANGIDASSPPTDAQATVVPRLRRLRLGVALPSL